MFIEIPNYPGYLIDDIGTVMSLRRNEAKILKHAIDSKGYHFVQLYNDQGRLKRVAIHRMVMRAWIGPSHLHVDHWNDNKSDNSLLNLEYVTLAENKRRAKENNKVAHGTGHAMSKLTEYQVLDIMKMKDLDKSPRQVGDLFSVHRDTVRLIWKGKIWKRLLAANGYEISSWTKRSTYVKNGKTSC